MPRLSVSILYGCVVGEAVDLDSATFLFSSPDRSHGTPSILPRSLDRNGANAIFPMNRSNLEIRILPVDHSLDKSRQCQEAHEHPSFC